MGQAIPVRADYTAGEVAHAPFAFSVVLRARAPSPRAAQCAKFLMTYKRAYPSGPLVTNLGRSLRDDEAVGDLLEGVEFLHSAAACATRLVTFKPPIYVRAACHHSARPRARVA